MNDELIGAQFLFRNDEDIGFDICFGAGTKYENEIYVNDICNIIFEDVQEYINAVKDESFESRNAGLNDIQGQVMDMARRSRSEGLNLEQCVVACGGVILLMAHNRLESDEYNGVQSSWVDDGGLIHFCGKIHGHKLTGLQ